MGHNIKTQEDNAKGKQFLQICYRLESYEEKSKLEAKVSENKNALKYCISYFYKVFNFYTTYFLWVNLII